MQTLETIHSLGIIPVAVIDDASHAVPLAKALCDGGIPVAEITFRTAGAEESIRQIKEHCPELLVGAGTIISLSQCRCAVESGAAFIVSPGFSAEIALWCADRQIPYFPGCLTPSEIMRAMSFGLSILKFFPADTYGGLQALRALSGPFPSIRFIPTGGVKSSNLADYLSSPFVYAVGGSWICSRRDINNGAYSQISEKCREAVKIAAACRDCGSGD